MSERICQRPGCDRVIPPESRFDRETCSKACQKSLNRQRSKAWHTYQVTVSVSTVLVVRTSQPQLIENPKAITKHANQAIEAILKENRVVVLG